MIRNKKSLFNFNECILPMIEDIYDLQLPSPHSVIEWNGLQNREIHINYDIDEEIIDVGLQIINWNNQDDESNIPINERKPIKIYINSNGGDLLSTFNLIDIINISKTPVYTIGMANCYSSGGLLLLSGHKRLIFPNTTFLLHDGYTDDNNSLGKVMDKVKFTEKIETKVRDYVISKTKINKNLYNKKYREDWYLLANEMIELGIADEIISDISQIK